MVKKKALKWFKQQVSALLCGEDLPEGAQAREVAKVPYQIPAVPREAKDCLVSQQSFVTHHRLIVHMGVHRGEKYPCYKCGKVLTNKKVWRKHTSACVHGKKVACSDCGKQYAISQGMRQHHRARHGVDAPELHEGFKCPFCNRMYWICMSMLEHRPIHVENPNHKGSFYCRVTGCLSAGHVFTQIKNLNSHLSNMHAGT